MLGSQRPAVTAIGPGSDDLLDRAAVDAGLDTVIAVPLTVATGTVAVLQFYGNGPPKEDLVTTVWHGASQLGRVVERARSRDELSHQALHDALTGLPNRSLLMDRLGHALAGQARERGIVALIFFDLDNFKLINDSLGHEAGDDLVVKVARRLSGCSVRWTPRPDSEATSSSCSASDLSRRGGCHRVAERILAAIAEPMSLRGATTR